MLTFDEFADREGVNLSLLGEAQYCELQARLEGLQPEIARFYGPLPAADFVAPY